MTDTSDFDVWLEENKPSDFETIYNLYRAVLDRESFGEWDVMKKDAKTFVKGHTGTLQLLSEKARFAFLARVDDLKDDPEMTMEGWYQFKRSMSKAD